MLAMIVARAALAFHDGSSGSCDACHTMHQAAGDAKSLLKASDTASICLNCHEQPGDIGPTTYHVSTSSNDMQPGKPPRQLSPAGDFGWLKKNYSWLPDQTNPAAYSYGDRHGHNIVARDYLYTADMISAAAPGGSYPSASLSCISCHDPHGKYRRNADGSISTEGNPILGSGSSASSDEPRPGSSVGVYRMLAGRNYQPRYLEGSHAFAYDPPAAIAPADYNRSEAVTRTRVAYGAGMSEWCRNCHEQMHTTFYPGIANLIHVSGEMAYLGSVYAAVYNAYVKTGDLSGQAATSYFSLVPFEEGIRDYPTLKLHANSDGSYRSGPDGVSSKVMCLTCHRAHASAWDGATRWNTKTPYVVYGGMYSQQGQAYQPYGQGRTEEEALRAYYDIPANEFAADQTKLCNKCHTGSEP